MDYLENIHTTINKVLAVKIEKKTREADFIHGRNIYFKLAENAGIKASAAAERIGLDRTTAIHSNKKWPVKMRDKLFRMKLEMVEEALSAPSKSIYAKTPKGVKGLLVKIKDLEKEVKSLNYTLDFMEERGMKWSKVKEILYNRCNEKDEDDIVYFLSQIVTRYNMGVKNPIKD